MFEIERESVCVCVGEGDEAEMEVDRRRSEIRPLICLSGPHIVTVFLDQIPSILLLLKQNKPASSFESSHNV